MESFTTKRIRKSLTPLSTTLALFLMASSPQKLLAESNGSNAKNVQNPAPLRNNKVANRNNANAEAIDPAKIEDVPAPSAPPSQWPLDLSKRFDIIKPDAMAVRARIEALVTQPAVADPIVLKLLSQNPMALIRQLAKPEILASEGDMSDGSISAKALAYSLTQRLAGNKLSLIPEDLGWMDSEKLGGLLQSRTVLPSLNISEWRKALQDPHLRTSLDLHFQGQLPLVDRDIELWAQSHPGLDQIPMEVFLPKTVRPLFGKYSHLRGRNCFGTSLEFANPRSLLNKTVNVEAEEGHFRTMINSDEFLRALWLGYYEIKPEEILLGLKWGDVVVFYESAPPFSWMSLRHAAVHIAQDVYFQKQSKSAASPIEFTDWQSIMNVWSQLTPNLDYKVFRRLPSGSSFQKPNRAIEKLSWTR